MNDVALATLFVVFASGPSWLAFDAISLQVPYFQQHLPEGLCLNAWLSISGNFATTFIFAYYAIDKIIKISVDLNAIAMSALAPTTVIIAAFTYGIAIDKVSWPLLICTAVGAIIGWMQYQGAYPVLTRYNETYTIAARSASNILGVVLGAIVFYQDPGSDSMKFSPYVFLLGVGFYLLIFPSSAYLYIYLSGTGLKNDKGMDMNDIEYTEVGEDSNLLPLVSAENDLTKSEAFTDTLGEEDSDVIYLAAAICWMDFHNWGLLPSVLPFVFNRNFSGVEEGSICFSYSLNLVSLMYVFGGLSTYLFRIPIPICLLVFSFCITLLYLSVFDGLIDWFEDRCWALVLLYCTCNLFTAHVNTSVFNIISLSKDENCRSENIKFVGITTSLAILIGSVISIIISNIYFKCF